MAEYELMSGMPMLSLQEGMKVVLEAIDPATGAAVANIGVSKIAIYAAPLVGTGTEASTVVPPYIYSSGGTEAPGLSR